MTMITPSYLGETIEYSSLHACRSTLEDPTRAMEVLQTLSSSATAQVTVQRNGTSQELNLNLATLNLEPESGDNAASGATPEAAPAGPAGSAPRVRPGGANLGAAPVSVPAPGSNINPPSTGTDSASAGERER